MTDLTGRRRPAAGVRPPKPLRGAMLPRVLSLRTRLFWALLFWALALGAPGAAAAEGSIIVHPGEDVAALVAAAPEGSAFVFTPGLYRGVSITPKNGDRFIGLQHGAVLSGARVVTGFVADGPRWTAPAVAGLVDPAAKCEADRACGRLEAVFIDGVAQRAVTNAAAVTAGTFFVDAQAGRLVLGSDPTGKSVEVSATQHAFAGAADYVHIGGLVIEKYAPPPHDGAVGAAKRWTIEDCEVRLNDGIGIVLGDYGRAIHNIVHDNGRLGIGGGGAYVVVERNEVAANNIAGFDPDLAAGGVVLLKGTHAVLRDNYVHGNHGPGLAVASLPGAAATLYEGNRVEANDGPGILDELSRDATIRDNTLSGNGRRWAGAGLGAQLLVLDSSGDDVYRNTIAVPDGGAGIMLEEQPGLPVDSHAAQPDGSAGAMAGLAARDDFVHDNDITLTGVAGVAAGVAVDGGAPVATLDDHLDRNRYHAPMPDGRYWRWPGVDHALTLDELRAQTREEHDGTVDYVPAVQPPKP